jgi:hypothetical protein
MGKSRASAPGRTPRPGAVRPSAPERPFPAPGTGRPSSYPGHNRSASSSHTLRRARQSLRSALLAQKCRRNLVTLRGRRTGCPEARSPSRRPTRRLAAYRRPSPPSVLSSTWIRRYATADGRPPTSRCGRRPSSISARNPGREIPPTPSGGADPTPRRSPPTVPSGPGQPKPSPPHARSPSPAVRPTPPAPDRVIITRTINPIVHNSEIHHYTKILRGYVTDT